MLIPGGGAHSRGGGAQLNIYYQGGAHSWDGWVGGSFEKGRSFEGIRYAVNHRYFTSCLNKISS